jgi:hypothetical protein
MMYEDWRESTILIMAMYYEATTGDPDIIIGGWLPRAHLMNAVIESTLYIQYRGWRLPKWYDI